MRRAYLTVDVEPDCPPYMWTHRGIDEGAPALLALLRQHRIRATWFTTGAVARRSPQLVDALLADGHELGCHGDAHLRLGRVPFATALDDLERATETLTRVVPVRSFRAPNLDLPPGLLPALQRLGYRLDSSEGRHKHWGARVHHAHGLLRVPATTTSSVLRLPPALTAPLLARCEAPLVLFLHPWELVDWRTSSLRWDCRAGTGPPALAALDELLLRLVQRGFTFHRLDTFLPFPSCLPAPLHYNPIGRQ